MPATSIPKSQSLASLVELAAYSRGVEARLGDIHLYSGNLTGALDELVNMLQHNEQQERLTHRALKPELVSPAEIASLREAINHAETNLSKCVVDLSAFLVT